MNTILSFLRNLEANNNKPWFDAHKNEYQEARAHFNAIVEKLIEDIELGGGDFDGIIKGLHPSLSLDQDQKLKCNYQRQGIHCV